LLEFCRVHAGNFEILLSVQGWEFMFNLSTNFQACSGVVGWDTMLQARRLQVQLPMRSLHFLIDPILPATLWALGLTQPLTEVPGIFLGVKGSQHVRLMSPPSVSQL
jgi:hypothetical protein